MKFCGKCGTKIVETQKFCAKCGAPINNVKTTAPKNNAGNTTNAMNNNGNTISNINNSNNPNGNFNVAPKKANVTPKKPINKLMILIPAITLIILVVAILGTKSYFSKKYSPKAVISKFQNCILTKDADSLKYIICSLNDSLDLDKNDAEAIIQYLSKNSSALNNVITNLNNDLMLAEDLTVKGSPLLLDDGELFALTVSNQNFLFTKYEIMVRPLYLKVCSNELPAKIFIGDDEVGIIGNDDLTVEVGPIAPGIYNVTLKTTDVLGNELSETLSTNPIDILDKYSLDFFDTFLVTRISTNIPEASIFINGEDTGKIAKDYEDGGFGPISEDDVIQLVYTANGTTYKTKERSLYNSYYSYLDLSFSYSDYEKIQATLSSNTNESVADYIEKYASRDYIIGNSDTVKLDFKAMNAYTAEELFIARNEMFARHGYVFKSSPNLQSYFESKSWYTPDENYSGDLSGEIEKSNVGMIKSLEFLKMAYDSCQPVTSDYVFPNSDTVEISASEVSALNDWELIIARNEIYARYGLNFSTKELVEHFTSKSWFSINSSVGNDVSLNAVENKNIATILEEEKKRMNSAVNHDLGE